MGDPSEKFCRIIDSFEPQPVFDPNLDLPEAYSIDSIPDFEVRIITNPDPDYNPGPNPALIDLRRWNALQEAKAVYGRSEYERDRRKILKKTNPFEDLRDVGNYLNDAGTKLANMDAIFNLTRRLAPNLEIQGTREFLDPEGKRYFKFATIADAPGGFVQHIQRVAPVSLGFGISLMPNPADPIAKQKKIPVWQTKKFPRPAEFKIVTGNHRGDIIKEWENFSRAVIGDGTNLTDIKGKSRASEISKHTGAHLATADGGFEISGDADFNREEFLHVPLILAEILIGILVVTNADDSGYFVCKIFDSVTEVMADLIFICAMAFKSIRIFKPITSRPGSAERYLICKGKRENIDPIIDILIEANQIHASDSKRRVTKILSSELPENFKIWLKKENEVSVKRQFIHALDTLNVINNLPVKSSRTYEYSPHLCEIIWNLKTENPGL